MRNPRTLRDIAQVAAHARHPERLARLIALIENERGYALYQAVSGENAALSDAEAVRLRFRHADFAIDREITRAEFEQWIARDCRAWARSDVSAARDPALGEE